MLGAALLLLAGCAEPVDLLLRGGRVLDGTGSEEVTADVAVRDGRIVAVGNLRGLRAARVIDASGMVVAPGFVDLHSHADLILLGDDDLQERLLGAKLRQGVTTLVVGNCGLGVAPADADAAALLSTLNGWMTPRGIEAGKLDMGAYLDRLERGGVRLNVAALVPHGPLRISAMGLSSGPPSAEQLEAMRSALARSLDAGAWGLSTGLIYPPGMYSDTEELVALAAVVAQRDRLFTAHVRGSSETLIPAVEELIDVARRSGARVHHSHLEAVGEPFWPDVNRVLELEDRGRAEGLSVSHDVFPYTRAATMMSAIFPPWALEGGLEALLERLRDPELRERIRLEVETRKPEWPPWNPGGWPHNLVEAVGWEGIFVASVADGGPRELAGRSLAAIAQDQGRRPFDVVADLMLATGGQVGQQVAEISGADGRTETLLRILAHPAAALISDAEDYGYGTPHPAHAGAFARGLRLSREEGALPLPEMVRRMTSYPAELIGIDRGVIREGAPADLVVFDPRTITDRADWANPRRSPAGIRLVVLNGLVVVDDKGRITPGGVGKVLRAT